MVKLLLTVRRLANTWGGVYGQCGRKIRRRGREIDKEREGGRGWDGEVKFTEVIIPIPESFWKFDTSHINVPERRG